MKKLSLWLIALLGACSVIAQTVTIKVQGNRNKQVAVDGTVYTLEGVTSGNQHTPIVIANLATGQHTLDIVNGNANNDLNNETSSTIFKVRPGYDMNITVRNNGAVQLKETRASASTTGHPAQYKTPMSSTAFNTLMQNVRRQKQANRYSYVNTAFSNSSNYFTTTQAEQLILQVNSQNYRVALLKKVYLRVTDPENFSMLYEMLNSEARRNEVIAYVNNYNYGMASTGSQSSHNAYISPMSEVTFNSIYQAARNQSGNLRTNYILDALANANNYFTSYQARQLIQLVPTENERLILAKTSYRGITDASNFSQVSDLLYSASSRNDLAAYVSSYRSGTTYTPTPAYPSRTPMTDATFRALYNSIESEWLPGAEMNALRQAFANTSNYFTTAQTKELISLVSLEANRLELAKAAYKQTTDPANYYSVISPLLTSTSNRNELEIYIRNTPIY